MSSTRREMLRMFWMLAPLWSATFTMLLLYAYTPLPMATIAKVGAIGLGAGLVWFFSWLWGTGLWFETGFVDTRDREDKRAADRWMGYWAMTFGGWALAAVTVYRLHFGGWP